MDIRSNTHGISAYRGKPLHDDPPPILDVREPGSLGHYLGWMAAKLSHIVNGMSEIKNEMEALSMSHNAKERQHDIQTGVEKERLEQRKRGEERLGRWKLRAETVAAIGAAGAFFFGMGMAIGKFVLGN